jgi:leucyl-tRNA synthetase
MSAVPAPSRSASSHPVAPAAADRGEGALGDDTPPFRYNARLAGEIEARWQDRWDERGTFHTPNPEGPLSDGFDAVRTAPKLFVMDMFPYPSGAGLHVGHPLGYIATDVFARFKRMTGHNVLHTMGYDAYGLPAEQHAVATGQHPRINTEQNIEIMARQLRRLGLGHDPRRAVRTTDRDFLEFTQRIFLRIFNAWFDPEAVNPLGGRGAARHIDALVTSFALGERPTPDGRAWSSMTTAEQRELIDSYRLVYTDEVPVNWCPGLGTIVANEEVTADGRSDRGNFPVFKRSMRQWLMRITAYSERLIDDLDLVDWPEPVKLMQRNWIGRSHGARVRFASAAGDTEVFTTRPDTLFGATFMVLSPEHPMVSALTTSSWPAATDTRWTGGAATPGEAVRAYQQMAAARTDIDRQAEAKEKTGVFIGSFAVNPVNGREIPVFIADYVLMGYGTGAIMAVPSGDQRDFEFARQFGLSIEATFQPPAEWFQSQGIDATLDCSTWPVAYAGDGEVVNSRNDTLDLNGMNKADAIAAINAWLAAHGHGHGTVQTKLRDWLFSRQRYWGEPFPIVYDEIGPIGVPEAMLPVDLPDTDQFAPRSFDPDDAQSEPERPLDRLTEWKNATLDLGSGDGPRAYVRETNVMPQWAGSCTYYLRYIDPTLVESLTVPANERYWMGERGVDLYIGGVEHAVLHLLYSRFWHKVLFDLGVVGTPEPFARLFNQGYIQASAYTDARGVYVEASEVVERDGSFFYDGEPVKREFGKIGKSLKNMVSPDDMYEAYGADTLRLYEMSMGPLEASKPWETRAVSGAHRLLQRIWRLIVDEQTGALRVSDTEPTRDDLVALHRCIDAVRASMDDLRVNTPIARLTELTNHLTSAYPSGAPRSLAEPLVLMLAPFAPHLAEELWSRLGHDHSLVRETFPVADPAYLVSDTVEVPVQVNGKVRSVVTVAADADQATLEAAARADDKIAAQLDGKTVRKVVVVPGRLVNFVIS